MYLKAFLLTLYLVTYLSQGQDTTQHGNNYSIRFYYKNRKLKKGLTYDSNHKLQEEYHFKKYSNIGVFKTYHSDSSYSIGKKKWHGQKWGKWKTYDRNGKLLKIERFKYHRYHGLQRNFVTGEMKRYKYGIPHDELGNSKGKKYVFWFTVGMPSFKDRSCETERYACQTLPIAGCLVYNATFRTMRAHNSLVYIRQSLRFGFRWKKKFWNGIDCNGSQLMNFTYLPSNC